MCKSECGETQLEFELGSDFRSLSIVPPVHSLQCVGDVMDSDLEREIKDSNSSWVSLHSCKYPCKSLNPPAIG